MENSNMIVETLPTSTILVKDSDSQREEIDIFTNTNELLPPDIESDDYDSEKDIHFLKELLIDDSIPILENELSNFDHQDDPSFPRPPPEPSDVEIFFKPDSGVLTTNVVKGISEHYVLMPNILPTLPTFDHLYPMYDTLLPYSSKNEDKVFKPGGGWTNWKVTRHHGTVAAVEIQYEVQKFNTREVDEDSQKLQEFRRLSIELESVRMRDGCIDELKMSNNCDEVLESIEIMRRMQLGVMEKASHLLLMAKETQSKIYEKNTFIVKLRGQRVVKRINNGQDTSDHKAPLRGDMAAACEKRIGFVKELESVRGIIATAKVVEILKETRLKDDVKLAQLRDLER
nr:hypothetical protein [Tanacetum cinerariifolium]